MSLHVNIRDNINKAETWGGTGNFVDELGKVSIHFNEKVYVTEKLYNYDSFKFLIDIGSSLGLWLGLSVLGLYDILV